MCDDLYPPLHSFECPVPNIGVQFAPLLISMEILALKLDEFGVLACKTIREATNRCIESGNGFEAKLSSPFRTILHCANSTAASSNARWANGRIAIGESARRPGNLCPLRKGIVPLGSSLDRSSVFVRLQISHPAQDSVNL